MTNKDLQEFLSKYPESVGMWKEQRGYIKPISFVFLTALGENSTPFDYLDYITPQPGKTKHILI